MILRLWKDFALHLKNEMDFRRLDGEEFQSHYKGMSAEHLFFQMFPGPSN